MDRNELRNRAAPRRNTGEQSSNRITWHCDYCSRDFAFEKSFMNHACKVKQRTEELRTPIGQAAFAHYSEWMKIHRRTTPPIATFAESKYYGQFIRFARHAVATNLPDVNEFIRLMAEHGDQQPVMWCSDHVYAIYLQAYDLAVSPVRQFIRGLDALIDHAAALGVPLSDIFPALGVDTLYKLIGKRKLTFWTLLASDRFKQFLLRLPVEQKELLAGALNIPAAIARIKQEPHLAQQFAAGMKEKGL